MARFEGIKIPDTQTKEFAALEGTKLECRGEFSTFYVPIGKIVEKEILARLEILRPQLQAKYQRQKKVTRDSNQFLTDTQDTNRHTDNTSLTL